RQVVTRAGDHGRVEPLGQGHERLRGPRDTHELVEQATPVSAERHAIHRIPRNPLALRREAPQATSTATATDVPWDDHVLAATQRPGIITDVDDLGDALIAERERPGERRRASDERAIKISRRRSERAHDGVTG